MAAGTPVGLFAPTHQMTDCPGCCLKLRLIPKWCFTRCVILLGPVLSLESLVLQNFGRKKDRVGNGWRMKKGKEPTITKCLLCTRDCATCHGKYCSFPKEYDSHFKGKETEDQRE